MNPPEIVKARLSPLSALSQWLAPQGWESPPLVQVHNFAYGVLNPGLAYLMSCLGCFLGLQCTQRARAQEGAGRARWLLLAAVSIGVTGIWVMHFIAMLGFAISGQLIQYNVPVTILSMVIAVVVVAIGLLIVGFGGTACAHCCSAARSSASG